MKKDYNYICCFAEVERIPCGIPKLKTLLKKENDVLQVNKELHNGKYDIGLVRIWIPQFPINQDSFRNKIKDSEHARKIFPKKWLNSENYVEYLYNEYLAWLQYMATLNLPEIAKINMLKKYFASFFSNYNNAYFLNKKHQTIIREKSYLLNPLIVFWFECQDLCKALKLPKFTPFMPKTAVLYDKLNANGNSTIGNK